MTLPKCFGTLLWNADDEQCRTCDVFHPCQAALIDAADGTAGTSHIERASSNAAANGEPMQSAIEQAFSSGPQSGGPPPDDEPSRQAVPPAGHRSPQKLVPFSTRLPEGLDVDVKVFCALNKMSVQTFMAQAIHARLKK